MKKSFLVLLICSAILFNGGCFSEKKDNPVSKPMLTNDFSWDNAAVYFVYVDRFFNGDKTNDQNYNRKTDYGSPEKNVSTFHGGDLVGLTKKLEEGYFTDLGINAIWVTGVYEQIHGWVGGGANNDFPHYGYHGYYTMDFTMIDRNYGTIEEFRKFVNLAHSKNIRVIMDAGLNHPGYSSFLDAVQYDFGGVKMTEEEAVNHIEGWGDSYFSKFNFSDKAEWEKWWGSDWVREGSDENNQNVLTESIFGLADFKTESKEVVNIPYFLKKKWENEGDKCTAWENPSAAKYKKDLELAQSDYVIKWVSSWVEEFGIDGFRCDVVDNVDLFRWKQLNQECNTALDKWRSKNKDKTASNWKDKFWMTGDIWDSNYEVNKKYADVGFKSIVNFTFPKTGDLNSIGDVWQKYADYFYSKNDWNALSFLNNTYKRDVDINNMINCGTTLMLAPSAIQIFYGDEVARPLGVKCTDDSQSYRSDYVWGQNQNILRHWQKLGKFRNKHKSVGMGKQIKIEDNCFARVIEKDGKEDKVIIKLSNKSIETINVKNIFENNTVLRNAYTGETAEVKDNKVEFKVINSVILVEMAD